MSLRDIVEAVHDGVGGSLRSVWTFDRGSETCHYRRDSTEAFGGGDSAALIDNERYGFITHMTHDDLSPEAYGYTVRGFETFQVFRTFLRVDGRALGLLVCVDSAAAVDFGALHRDLLAHGGRPFGGDTDPVSPVTDGETLPDGPTAD